MILNALSFQNWETRFLVHQFILLAQLNETYLFSYTCHIRKLGYFHRIKDTFHLIMPKDKKKKLRTWFLDHQFILLAQLNETYLFSNTCHICKLGYFHKLKDTFHLITPKDKKKIIENPILKTSNRFGITFSLFHSVISCSIGREVSVCG